MGSGLRVVDGKQVEGCVRGMGPKMSMKPHTSHTIYYPLIWKCVRQLRDSSRRNRKAIISFLSFRPQNTAGGLSMEQRRLVIIGLASKRKTNCQGLKVVNCHPYYCYYYMSFGVCSFVAMTHLYTG